MTGESSSLIDTIYNFYLEIITWWGTICSKWKHENEKNLDISGRRFFLSSHFPQQVNAKCIIRTMHFFCRDLQRSHIWVAHVCDCHMLGFSSFFVSHDFVLLLYSLASLNTSMTKMLKYPNAQLYLP